LIRATGLPQGTVIVTGTNARARFQLVGKLQAARVPLSVAQETPVSPGGELMTTPTAELVPPETDIASPSSTAVIVLGLPNWVFPSMNSVPFDAAGDIVLPAVGVESVIFSFTVPQGFNGVLKEIGNAFIGGGFTDGSGAIIWRILQNNQAVRGKENIQNSLGSVAAPSRIGGGGFIRVLENDIVAMSVLNVSIVPSGQLIAGRLSGWFYPKDEDPTGIWF
jgi:hypothetical protein